MAAMLQLTKGKFNLDREWVGAGPVWINPVGVNSVEPCADGKGSWVRMDDGTGYLVAEEAEYVVLLIDSVNETEEANDG